MQIGDAEMVPAKPARGRLASWLPMAIAASMIGGLCGFFFKLALLAGVDLFLLNFTTSLILALTAYGAIAARAGKFRFSIGKIAIISGVIAGIGQLSYFAALDLGPVSIVAVLINLCPAVAIILSMIFIGEKISRTQLLGICLAILAGILLVV